MTVPEYLFGVKFDPMLVMIGGIAVIGYLFIKILGAPTGWGDDP